MAIGDPSLGRWALAHRMVVRFSLPVAAVLAAIAGPATAAGNGMCYYADVDNAGNYHLQKAVSECPDGAPPASIVIVYPDGQQVFLPPSPGTPSPPPGTLFGGAGNGTTGASGSGSTTGGATTSNCPPVHGGTKIKNATVQPKNCSSSPGAR
jgi:hypothetical protein